MFNIFSRDRCKHDPYERFLKSNLDGRTVILVIIFFYKISFTVKEFRNKNPIQKTMCIH